MMQVLCSLASEPQGEMLYKAKHYNRAINIPNWPRRAASRGGPDLD